MEKLNYCEQCIHYAVCSLKDNFHKLSTEINDKSRLLENKEFSLSVVCKHKATESVGIR